ncbi:MAG: uroporphyrinogen-III C-methyltransferase [Woeseiaceae bacterium]
MNQKPNDNDAEPVTKEALPAVPDIADDEFAETTTDAEAAAAAAARPARRKTTVSSAIAWLALLLALVAVAGTGFLYWTARMDGTRAARSQESIATLSGNVDEALESLAGLRSRLAELATSDSEYADEIASLEKQLDDVLNRFETIPGRLTSVESAIASLQGISTGARDTWLLAEAEYYMQIANAQLQLAGNPEHARLALGFADQRIRELANPALIDVRRALSRELRELDAMEEPDIEGMTMTLASLADEVDTLPLRQDVTTADQEAIDTGVERSGFDRALASLKRAFSGIVSVRRTDEEVTPLMSPDAAYFLRANLALQLQTARLALLRGEQAIFEKSLNDASSWLNRYYASDSQAVQSTLETIAGLTGSAFSVTPPDISESLRLLRQFRTRRAQDEAIASPAEPAQ